ncbi:exonuclease domain-containing protein [Effusibacillus dendaii]|uniref:Exonuclease domain-containing protein n=1 Tax=Effusibacillus dendaii TaxID=2743772 RepID=A0A7I8D570_9BACL|nr:exonuclease domain-containing protein [Effusibacillus dendaii]BCJ85225.1 hypothetical protein skT53_02100 [Effusibacillus dendaii]
MSQDRSGFFRRLLQTRSHNVLPALSAVSPEKMQGEAFIRQLLKEAKSEDGWDAPLLQTRFVVVDTETTGFNPSFDVLISIGAVEMHGDRIELGNPYHSLIRPEFDRFIPAVVTKLTGITNEQAAAAPDIKLVLQQFLEYAKDGVLVMHHASHDIRFLNAALWRFSRAHLTHRILDTHDVAKWLHPRWNQYGLDDLLQTYQIPVLGRHTALGDAKMTAELWKRLLTESIAKGIETFGELREQMVLANR